MDLYQSCSNYAPGPLPGTWSAFYRYLYVSFKQNSGERFRATWPSCLLVDLQEFFFRFMVGGTEKRKKSS